MSKLLKSSSIIFLSSVLITILIKLFVLQLYDYKDDSMVRTIAEGDNIIVCKIFKEKVNDIILYKDSADILFLSRIVGIENDEIIISKGKITVNGNDTQNKKCINEYCLKFINTQEFEDLETKYDLIPVNNSGTYKILLTTVEYDEIVNDSISSIAGKIRPVSGCSYNFNNIKESLQTLIVPKDSVFVLNDNRINLNDSRTSGYISLKDIVGKVVYYF